MTTIPVCTPQGAYDVLLQAGALARAGALLDLQRRVLIVTDSGVPARYARALADQCQTPLCVTLPGGEDCKRLAVVEDLLRQMLAAGFTRGDCVAAVGGGVVSDVSGLAAALYMRGIDFYTVPTTLLVQVDASVGGKTAVDLAGVKNAVGAFHQPARVLIDPETLTTLPPRQLSAGLAEAIKVAVTLDADLFQRIEQSRDLSADLPEIICRAVQLKKAVVEQDPTEQGLRRVLNFGHTLGHGLESVTGLLHGECIAAGMLPMCGPRARARLEPVLAKYGLPTALPVPAEQLLPFLRHDKKAGTAGITTVWADDVGTYRFETLTPEDLLAHLEATR